MPYNLRYFSDFISEHFNASFHVRSIAHYDQLRQRLLDHAKHCKNQLTAEIIDCTTGQHLALRIRSEQVLIIAVMDELDLAVNFGPDPDMYYLAKGDEQVNLAKQLYMSLTEMLHYLFMYFSDHLDSSLHLPALYRKTRSLEMEPEIASVIYGLRSAGVGETLLKMLDEPFNCLKSGRDPKNPSFHQCFYLEKLIRHIGLVLSDDTNEKTDMVLDMLLTLNFNLPAFSDHCIRRFKKQLGAQKGSDRKIEMLRSLSARIEERCHDPAPAWDAALPSLKDRLINWLHAGLNRLEWKPKPEVSSRRKAGLNAPPRIQTVMSVPQMAHMLRLMLETGLYINIPTIDAIRFQSDNFSAPLSKNISAESMRQKFYTPDSPTTAAVRELLRNMIAHSYKLSP